MEIENPHNDFLIVCSHGAGPSGELIARIAEDSEVLTERNAGLGSEPVGSAQVAEETQNKVAHFSCPHCSFDVQLRPDTLRNFVAKHRELGLLQAELSLLQHFATRPRKDL